MGISPNADARAELADLSVSELQEKLLQVAPERLGKMNNSDRNNPRRLVRALEVAVSVLESTMQKPAQAASPFFTAPTNLVKTLTLGITDKLEVLHEKITQRVRERFENGAVAEVERVLEKIAAGKLVQKPVLSALGFKELAALSMGEGEREAVLDRWAQRETQYVKRQLTWFKKYAQDAVWFQGRNEGEQEKLGVLVEKFIGSE